ncbi:MAG: ice-binding family protein [Minisyncoccia bacterium]
MKKLSYTILAVFTLFAFIGPNRVLAATTPSLGTANTFGLISNLFQHNATTTINGAAGNVLGVLGYSSIAGLGIINTTNGTTEVNNAAWTAAGIAQNAALANLNNQVLTSCTNIGEAGNLDAIVIGAGAPGHFPPGCYYRAGAMNIVNGGTVTLDGAGTYIFKSTGGAITTGANSFVVLNGASACDVFWIPVGATTLGAPSTFKGTVIDAAGITIGDTVGWVGRALAYGGTVTSNGAVSSVNTITVPSCTNPGSLTVTKTVINDNGRSNVVSDFPLFVGATAVVSGILNNFVAGVYAITETNNPDYAQTFTGDCVGGSITLASDGNYVCGITNNDIAASVPGGHRRDVVTTYTAPTTTTTATTTSTTTFVAPPYFYIPSLPNTGFADSNPDFYRTFFTYLGVFIVLSLVIVAAEKKHKV